MRNKQAIITLFIANSISGFAQGISMIAIPWYFVDVLNMPDLLGKVFMLVMVISLFWGIYAGSIVDRFNRKHVYLAVSSVGCAMLLAVAGFGYYAGQLPAMLVGVVYCGTFFIYNIHYPNLYAFIQEISDPKDYDRVTSYIEIQGQATTVIAGALAAILLEGTSNDTLTIAGWQLPVNITIEPWPLHQIFLLDGITYILAISLIATIRFKAVAERWVENDPILERLRTGFNFLKENPMLLLFGVFASNIFVTVLIINFYLKPIYITNHLKMSGDVYASYELYFALGSLFAGLTIRHLFKKLTTPMAVIILMFTASAVYFMFAWNTNLWLFYAGAFLVGLGNAGSRIMRVTYLFRRTPNQIIGRTGSIFNTANVLFRIFFTLILLLPFFYKGENVIWAYVMFATFLSMTAITLIIYYRRIVAKPIINEQKPAPATKSDRQKAAP